MKTTTHTMEHLGVGATETKHVSHVYPDTMTAREARDQFLALNGLGDGGYDDDWVNVKFGWVPLVFPNTNARKREVRAHDLHHVLTNSDACWNVGELDVSAFEVAAGGPGRFLLGWVLILHGFALGLHVRPRGVFRAFARGRGARNLFGRTIDDRILDRTLGELRAELGVRSADDVAWTWRDLAAFCGWQLAANALAASGLALLIGLVTLGVLAL